MSPLQSRLIQLLADGQFHSGQVLGDALGVSRMTIHKHINKLEELGIEVFRVYRKGYALAQPLQLISISEMREFVQFPITNIQMHHITGSTNDDMKQALLQGQEFEQGDCVLAEMQTAGRGRRGKPWQSPFGSNIYVSMYWPLIHGLNAAIGMSVALGVGIAKHLVDQGLTDVQIKWPNDIYIRGKKVAGILVELEGQPHHQGHAIVGVGLNLMMPTIQEQIDQPFTTIQSEMDQPLNRNRWAALLLDSMYEALMLHDVYGLKPLVDIWRQFDIYYQKPVRILLGQHEQQGIAQGIDELGALLVEQNGQIKRYFGGEISVRKQIK